MKYLYYKNMIKSILIKSEQLIGLFDIKFIFSFKIL
jgi:hypothetical protein